MYTNETGKGYIKVYPNKDAIKQMTLKNNYFSRPTSVFDNAPMSQSASNEKGSLNNSSKENDSSFDDLYMLLLILLMSGNTKDDSQSIFTLILSTLFLY
ncbi:MAG: hypothetical protein J6K12_00560 [Clostridia bacterium]|nr:hypothetical protein [Clostridia bacterium]